MYAPPAGRRKVQPFRNVSPIRSLQTMAGG